MAAKLRQKITTNQMYAGATNEEKDTMKENQGEPGERAIPSFWGERIKVYIIE